MTAYVGTRGSAAVGLGQPTVEVEDGAGTRRPLRHFPLHSPDGFEWGYAGSGPADLALAILADALQETPDKAHLYSLDDTPRSWTHHQPFKDAFIARFEREKGWRLDQVQVLAFVASREHTRLEDVVESR